MKKKWNVFVAGTILATIFSVNVFADCGFYEYYGYHDWAQTNFYYPTCTEEGGYVLECMQCATQEYFALPAMGHDWVWYVDYEGSCTEEGLGHSYCNNCGQTDYEPIQPLGHNWVNEGTIRAATCKTEGLARSRCTRCGKKEDVAIPKTSHTYGSWNISRAATDHSQGTRTQKCTVCGNERSENFYPDGTVLRGGDNNTTIVTELQQMLTDLHYLNDTVDGKFGPNTENAVKAFQAEHQLAADGIGWPQTLSELHAVLDGDAAEEEVYEYPAFCTTEYGEDATKRTYICEHHVEMNGQMYEALAEKQDPAERIELLNDYIEAWQLEMNTLYDQWTALASEKDKILAANSRAMFPISLASQKIMWERQMAGDQESMLQMEMNAYLDQCVEICQEANKLVAGKWTVTEARNPEDQNVIGVPEEEKGRYLELKENGTAFVGTQGENRQAAWKEASGGILVEENVVEGMYLEFEVSRLLLYGDGVILVFEKQDNI